MLALLPPLAIGAISLGLANLRETWGWGRIFLRSLIVCGAIMVWGTELLSLGHAVTPAALAGLWTLPILAGAAVVLSRLARGQRPRVPVLVAPRSWSQGLLLVGILLVAGITAVVAWHAPPLSWDALTYHMARVAHWAQNRSLAHYATGIPRQNVMTPGAEMAVLNLYVLGGGDRLANFVQWGAMVVSVIGAARLARQLGAGRTGQLFSAVFVAAMPVGIAQASSAYTDYVVAAWMTVVASEVLDLSRGDEAPNPLFVGLASGMAGLTKLTSAGYLMALALYASFGLVRRVGVARTLRASAAVAALFVGLNAGYYSRNLATYGNLLGSQRYVSLISVPFVDWRVVVSNVARNLSLHAGTPWERINRFLLWGVAGVHVKMGLDINDPRTSNEQDFRILIPRPDELRSGNLLQGGLAVAAVAVLAAVGLRRDSRAGTVLGYVGVVGLGFAIQSSVMKFTVFGSRYHLILFVLLAPAVAFVVQKLPDLAIAALGAGLVVYAWPWLVRLEPRPLIADREGRGVLTTARETLYAPPGLEFPFQTITDVIRGDSCRSVGIMLGGDAPEYLLWVDLGAPREDLTIEWIVAGTPSERYRRADFVPCAVVCDGSCPADWTMVRDLPLRLELSGYRLYQSP